MPSTSQINFTGIARLSPRLHLLRRLSGSDDPIMSVIARRMITDPGARRIGGWFEFIFTFFLPILLSVWMILRVSGVIAPLTLSGPYTIMTLYDVRVYLMQVLGIFALTGYCLGLLLALLPGLTLCNLEKDGETLRYGVVTAKQIMKKLVSIQIVSLVIPYMVCELFFLLTEFSELYTMTSGVGTGLRQTWLYMISGGILYFFTLWGVAMVTGFTGIIASMLYRWLWHAVAMSVVLNLFLILLILIPAMALLEVVTAPARYFPDDLANFCLGITIVTTVVLSIPVRIFIEVVIQKRILPRG